MKKKVKVKIEGPDEAPEEEVREPEPELSPLEQKDAEIAELKLRLMRLKADFDNAQKRMAREKQDFARYANSKLMEDLLHVLDNFDLAMKVECDDCALKEGMQMIRKQLDDVLAGHGLLPIATDGVVFDPFLHEAVEQCQQPDVPDGTVLGEHQRGYRLHDKVLRYAKVRVASAPKPAKDDIQDIDEKSEKCGKYETNDQEE